MELEEAIKILNDLKENVALFSTGWYPILKESEKKALETVLNYIKEESIPRAVVEEKIEEIDYSYKNIEKNYTEEQLDNYDVSEEDYIEMEKREFAEMILQEILNKGE